MKYQATLLFESVASPAIATNASAKFAICILIVSVSWASSQSTAPQSQHAGPSVSDIAVNFTNYQQITKSAVFVNPELAMLCRGASKEEVDAARIKFGPHANTGILIYMNKPAQPALRTNASVFPVGSVVVKQKTILGYFDKEGKRIRDADHGVGGMVKRALGYNPSHGDWEYFYFEEPTQIESGRISRCASCHESAKSKDYVFGTWNKTGE